MRPTPPTAEAPTYRPTPEERRAINEELKQLRPQTVYGATMKEAFASARVPPAGLKDPLVKRVVRVMKRHQRGAK